ncbi:CocE/NonD family hydrolase [Nocardia sp. NPDC020380]|uniref:CocE/NonD family hydrolase n=1 Tax=Nocardia sp. NPDC020380 TaxID=3364309 RepID=UPI0037A4F226
MGAGGVSYSGLNQLQAAAKNPPALKAIFPVVPGPTPSVISSPPAAAWAPGSCRCGWQR